VCDEAISLKRQRTPNTFARTHPGLGQNDLKLSPGGATENSPRRKPWVLAPPNTKSRRDDRTAHSHPGLCRPYGTHTQPNAKPSAHALGYSPPSLRDSNKCLTAYTSSDCPSAPPLSPPEQNSARPPKPTSIFLRLNFTNALLCHCEERGVRRSNLSQAPIHK